MLNKETATEYSRMKDWIFNGCIYYHREFDKEIERFYCSCNENHIKPDYSFCTRECKHRKRENHYVF